MRFLSFLFVAVSILTMTQCKSGPKKTPSGYEYVVVKKGSGPAAKTLDYVSFAIRIVGEDGKVLQEIPEGPTMPVMQIPEVMPTGKEANPVMESLVGSMVGDSIVLTMPIDSMPQAPIDLQNMKFIKYEVSIKKIQNKADFDKAQEGLKKEQEANMQASMAKMPAIEELVKTTLADYKAGKLETQKTASGLKYYIVTQGSGPNAAAGQNVSVQYYGNLMDGKMFDNSFSRGQAITFPLGKQQVIKGWDEGISLLNKGAKAFLFIPSALGYGEQGGQGAIPPNADLMFYVELEDIK